VFSRLSLDAVGMLHTALNCDTGLGLDNPFDRYNLQSSIFLSSPTRQRILQDCSSRVMNYMMCHNYPSKQTYSRCSLGICRCRPEHSCIITTSSTIRNSTRIYTGDVIATIPTTISGDCFNHYGLIFPVSRNAEMYSEIGTAQ
jgi:hypothetical protein